MSGERVPVPGFDETWLRFLRGREDGYWAARKAGDAARGIEDALVTGDTAALEAHAAVLVASTKYIAGTIADMKSLRSEIQKRDGGKA